MWPRSSRRVTVGHGNLRRALETLLALVPTLQKFKSVKDQGWVPKQQLPLVTATS